MPFSFSSDNRLASKHDFQSVFADGRKVTSKSFLVLYRSNQLPYPRLGIIIAKHHVKRAVDRNKLRRLVRESFRQHKEILKELDIVVLMRSKWCAPDNIALRNDIDHLWQYVLANSSKTVS